MSRSLTQKQLSLLTRAACYLSLQDEKAVAMKPFLKVLLLKLSVKKEWIHMPYAYQLKQFLLYVKHLYPAWNTSFAEHLFYHANKKMIANP